MTLGEYDDEKLPEVLLEEWSCDEAPLGFAERVAVSARADGSSSGGRGRGRGLLVPLLLAALFISAGAAAAWSQKKQQGVRSAETSHREGGLPVPKPQKLSFHGRSGEVRAEPERQIASPVTKRPALLVEQLVEDSSLDEEELPSEEAAPRVIHFPKCECGTSGVVCTCSD